MYASTVGSILSENTQGKLFAQNIDSNEGYALHTTGDQQPNRSCSSSKGPSTLWRRSMSKDNEHAITSRSLNT